MPQHVPIATAMRLRRPSRAPRAGNIGPVRREVIFEPLPETLPPAEPVPASPEPDRTPVKEPV